MALRDDHVYSLFLLVFALLSGDMVSGLRRIFRAFHVYITCAIEDGSDDM